MTVHPLHKPQNLNTKNNSTTKQIIDFLNKKNIDHIGVVINDLHSIIYQDWASLGEDFSFNFVPFIKVDAYSETKGQYEEFLFVISDKFDEAIYTKVYQHLKEQFIPFLSNESVQFLKRMNYPLMLIKNDKVVSAYTTGHEIFNLFCINENQFINFDCSPNKDNCLKIKNKIFKNTPNNLSISNNSSKISPLSLKKLISEFSYKDEEEKTILDQEITSLQEKNQDILFLLAYYVKDAGIQFNGNFKNFLLSKKIGLPLSKDAAIDEKEKEFVFECDLLQKMKAEPLIKDFLNKFSYTSIHPMYFKNAFFSDFFSYFLDEKSTKNATSTLDTMLEWTKIKDNYDAFSGSKKDFFEEMKFLFLLKPDELKSFYESVVALEKGISFEESDLSISAIVPNNTSDKDCLYKNDLAKKFIPYFLWEIKK